MSEVTRRIVAGSAGIASSENTATSAYAPRLRMLKPQGLYPQFISTKSPFEGYILPAFDETIPTYDTAHMGSVAPYRTQDLDPKTGHLQFSGWFVMLEGYHFYGKGKNSFFSPLNVGEKDPLADIFFWIYRQRKKGDFTYFPLVDSSKYGMNDIQPVPGKRNMYFMNALCPTPRDEEVKNRILMLGALAFRNMCEALNEFRPTDLEPVDPDWPRYVRGDITNPKAATRFKVVDAVDRVHYASLQFGNFNKARMTYDRVTKAFTQEELEGRYNLIDTETVIQIHTYEEIVDVMVDEGLIPYELFDLAGVRDRYKGQFPAEHKEVTYSTPSPAKEEEEDDIPLAPSPVHEEVPAAPKAQKKFWVSVDGGTPVKKMESELKAFLEQHPSAQYMEAGTSTWHPASDLIGDEGDDAPPPPPAGHPSVPVSAAPEEEKEMRTEEEEKLYKELNDKLNSSTPPAIEEYQVLMSLAQKRPFQA